MKKILILLALMFLFVNGCSSSTLAEAIQSKWKTPVQVVMSEDKHNGVIFKDGEQYVFNRFELTNGRYKYSREQEEGYRFSGGEIPLLIRTIYRDGVGDIVWGAIKTNKIVKEIRITFIDKKSQDHKISMNIPVVNNAFIGYPPDQFYRSEIEAATKWHMHVTLVDQSGAVLMERTY